MQSPETSPETSPVRAIRVNTITHAGVAIPSPSDPPKVLKEKYMKFVGVRIDGEPDGVEELRRRLAEPARFPNSRSASPMPGQGPGKGGTRRRRRSYRRRR